MTADRAMSGLCDEPYWFGVHVYRPPVADMRNVLADMAAMKSLGMNLVNLQSIWSWEN